MGCSARVCVCVCQGVRVPRCACDKVCVSSSVHDTVCVCGNVCIMIRCV